MINSRFPGRHPKNNSIFKDVVLSAKKDTQSPSPTTVQHSEQRRTPYHARLPQPQKSSGFSRPARNFGSRQQRPSQNQAPRKMNSNPRPMQKTIKKAQAPVPPIGENIRIIPLGGCEEIGKNMTVIEYGEDIVVIDAGFQFSNKDTPGVDYIIPNIKYLEERKEKIRGIIITHGHLDHIGGIPYIIDRIGNPPIYTREFGALLIKKRQEEFSHLAPLNIKICEKNETAIPIGKHFKIRFFGLTHSIPDSTGIIIETPLGDIVATGDVRVDNIDGKPTEKEIEQYSFFQKRKVLLLMMDSTGIEKSGWAISEDIIIQNIDKIVSQVPGRIIISTFASQVERIIAFIQIAQKYGKKVAMEGRSMKTNVEIIKHLNLTDTKNVITTDEVEKYPPHKIMILATGAQGEEFAALMRMANRTHKTVRLNKTDTIILSSSIIPGNELAITKLKDNLYHHDSKIITYLDSDVHASGHGKRGELEWIHSQIPYKFFVPVHGHHYMLKIHSELARGLGVAPENIIVPENGNIVDITEKGTKIMIHKEKIFTEDMVVEGFSIGDIQEVVIRDRQALAQDGMFIIFGIVNSKTGKLKKSPDIISRGFVYLRESQDLLHEAREIIRKTVEDSTEGMNPINFDYVKQNVTEAVGRYLLQKTAKRPIVIPVLLAI